MGLADRDYMKEHKPLKGTWDDRHGYGPWPSRQPHEQSAPSPKRAKPTKQAKSLDDLGVIAMWVWIAAVVIAGLAIGVAVHASPNVAGYIGIGVGVAYWVIRWIARALD